jgi:cob(I)alamin adenosyltransferase
MNKTRCVSAVKCNIGMAKIKKGYIHVYTGNGKGKTTAAIGLAIRAAGAGIKVFFAQFAKGKVCSEHIALTRLKDLITIKQYGMESFITRAPQKCDIEYARKGLAQAALAMRGAKYGVVILDEACYALSSGMISFQELKNALDEKSPGVEVIITGRNAPASLIKIADLVTEMKIKKHYYDKGVKARKGIEM